MHWNDTLPQIFIFLVTLRTVTEKRGYVSDSTLLSKIYRFEGNIIEFSSIEIVQHGIIFEVLKLFLLVV